MDIPGAVSAAQMVQTLQLDKVAGRRPWYVQTCCARTGEGLYEGLDWLSNALRKQGRD